MSEAKKRKVYTDRCSNPYNDDGHKGQDLRTPTKAMLRRFPDLLDKSRICRLCREKYYAEVQENNTDSITNSDLNENSFEEFSNFDLNEGESFNSSSEEQLNLTREEQLEEMLTGLKEKFSSLASNDPMKVSILTIAPNSWTIRQIAEEFNTSYRLAKKSKDLKKVDGILSLPTLKRGKTLPEETITKVVKFYEDDYNSRVIPGNKNTVTVKINGEKQKFQKRYLHADVVHLYSDFKKIYPDCPIGMTKFAEIRPKWCLLGGEKGTHSVCVCSIHENLYNLIHCADLIKLTEKSDIQIKDYKDCMKMVLCRKPTNACYVMECSSCPNFEHLSDYLTQLFESRNIRNIIFSSWQATDRCTLKNECLSANDFVIEFCSQLEKFIPHHFIANQQSEYIKNLKENLTEDTVILHCDFSENYAYTAQNAAPAFHFFNDQVTVHAAVLYYRSGSEVKHQSFILLSECTSHDVTAVYILQQTLIPEIKKLCPKAKKILYVSDNARQHYKNKYQMRNLMQHIHDFNIIAEWHTYAVAHGKCSCDAIAGKFKTDAYRASIQAKSTEAILTPDALFTWAQKHYKNSIRFYRYDAKKHAKTKSFLNKRFSKTPPVTGIQHAHAFFVEDNKLIIKRYSSDTKALNIIEYPKLI